jgi:cobalt-zinc-cadmium efflux system outer membrane protein
MLRGMINVPLQLERIRAGIDEARASLRAAQAALRLRRDELGAQIALQLFLARDSDRQLSLLEEVLLPRARDVVNAIEAAYATGGSSFLELLDAQRSLLALELASAELQVSRARAVAALEALCALDFGTLSPATGTP